METSKRCAAVVMGAALLGAQSAAAQTAPDPNPRNITITGSVDAANTYMFRGIRQNFTGIALWPAVDLGLNVYSGDGRLENAAINLGTWNSLHTGDIGTDGPTGKPWYEADLYAILELGFSGGVSLTTTYTAFGSPNDMFSAAQEITVQLDVDDSAWLGRAALRPYVQVAFEVNAAPGDGQGDGGANAGRYLELGVTPGWSGARASVEIPVKAGWSLSNYYELNIGTEAAPVFQDHTFGFFSVGAVATIPLTSASPRFGAWNVHGGVELQVFGETPKVLNEHGHHLVGSIGIGFTY